MPLATAGSVQLPISPPPPPAGRMPAESLISFDPQRTDLVWREHRWQLVAGDVLLKDFGRHQAEGRELQRLVRDLGLTQLGSVGSPRPVMEYWLTQGQPPRGMPPGLRLSPLDLANLRAEQVQEQWCVRDGHRILFNFGLQADDARHAVSVIRRHGFTHVAQVGRQPWATHVFVQSPDESTPARLTSLAPLVSRTTIPGNGAPRETAEKKPAGIPQGQSSGVTPAPLPSGPQFGTADSLRPDLANLAEHVPFDFRQVQVRRDGRDWKLTAGSYSLANFGQDEQGARLALKAVQHYRLNQHYQVGRPSAACSYFLANGRAPQGVMFGLSTTPFRPEKLTTRQTPEGWVIGDGNHNVLAFGDRADEAKQTLQAIQRHRFDHLCRIGQPVAMTFFVRAR